jgi:DNA polymerase III delta prime subunit
MLKENILKLTESDIKESVKVLQAQAALSEIVKDKEKDDKKEAKEVAKEKQKTLKQQEKDIKKQLSSAEFSVMDLF